MATVTIKFTQPTVPVDRKVASICALFEPTNSYVDSEPFAGTCYDTNVEGFGTWEGLVEYLGVITHTPNILIMFKAAVRDGQAELELEDAKMVEYVKEIGAALADFGFTVEAA